MKTFLTRFLRYLVSPFTNDPGERSYGFPVASIRDFQCFVVEPDGEEHWVIGRFPDCTSVEPRGRQHQFGGHPDVPFEGLVQ